ncbi:metallophosphoesterase family protein [Candidatus Riflebacteria bacterium]
MQRIAWLTDIHLNFLKKKGLLDFFAELKAQSLDAIWITGDIAESANLEEFLLEMNGYLKCPLYFVLGNHDFWHSSIEIMRANMMRFCRENHGLHWLGNGAAIPLRAGTSLIGFDGINDGRFGDFFCSNIRLRDYSLIHNFKGLDMEALYHNLNSFADSYATWLEEILPRLFMENDEVIILTHVPPFKESCLFKGIPANDNWLPHFTCKAVADVLLEIMRKNPEKKLIILSGHTHCDVHMDIAPNLKIKIGAAVYGKPQITEIMQF